MKHQKLLIHFINIILYIISFNQRMELEYLSFISKPITYHILVDQSDKKNNCVNCSSSKSGCRRYSFHEKYQTNCINDTQMMDVFVLGVRHT